MSRALTVYSRRRDEDTPEISAELERVMSNTGCSEPVARNLLKYGKLGIGPLAQSGDREGDRSVLATWDRRRELERRRESPPRQADRTAAQALAERKRKLREQEARLREQEEQREREVEEEEKARREEQARKRAGLTRLGPVLARQEEVDPLQPVPVEVHPHFEEDSEDDDGEEDKTLAGRDHTGAQAGQKADKKRPQVESGKKPGKKKRRRRRGGGFASDDSSEEPGRPLEGENGDEESRRTREARAGRANPGSPGAEAAGRGRESGSSAGAASSLMSEAEVLAMMGRDKKDKKTQRGSLRAKSRIQREMEEWESAKRENPEFWKAPKFSLCYSAETRKSRNY